MIRQNRNSIQWPLVKIAHFIRLKSGTTPKATNDSYFDGGTIPWLNTGDLNDSFILETNRKVTPRAIEDYPGLKLYPAKSLVVAMYGATIGKTGILTFPACVNQACCVFLQSKHFNTRFVHYWFIAHRKDIIKLGIGGGQPNISQNIIKDLKIPKPSLEIQNIIVNHLDMKCEQIDIAIRKKKELINKLEEEFEARVFQATRNGLKKYDLVRSGIPEYGDIPVHWSLKQIRHISKSVRTGKTPPTDVLEYFEDGEVNWYGPSDFNDDLFLQESSKKITSLAIKDKAAPIYKKNTLLIIGIGATLGKVSLTSETSSSNQQINAVELNEENDPVYFCYLLRSIKQYIISESYISTLAILNQQKTKSIKVVVPPRHEQLEISKYLNSERKRISKLKDIISKEINLIEEYKVALISETLSGNFEIKNRNN